MKKIIVIISSIAIFVTVVLVLLQAEEQITPIDSTKCPHRALLVMDLQKDFIGEDAKYPVEKSQVEPMLKAINNIIKRAGELDLEVIYIDTKFSKEQWLTNWFRNYAAIEGSEGVSLDERLSVTSKRIFTKNKQSAFTNKEFGQYLKERAIGKIIVAGVFADRCISSTAKSAKLRGYEVSVLRDGIAAGNERAIKRTVRYLKRKGVTFQTSADLLKELK